jgi:Niemann-Pick C1 protein
LSHRFHFICIHTQIIPAVVGLLLCLGFLEQVTYTDPIDIWVDPNSQFISEKKLFDSSFGPFYRIEQLMALPRNTAIRTDPLTASILADLYDLDQRIRAISGTDSDTGVVYTFDQLCAHVYPASPCIVNTPLDYFQGLSRAQLLNLTDDYIHQAVARGGRAPFGAPLGKTPYPQIVVGGVKIDTVNDVIQSAELLMITYCMNASTDLTTATMDWESKFLQQVFDFNDTVTQTTFYVSAERSINGRKK